MKKLVLYIAGALLLKGLYEIFWMGWAKIFEQKSSLFYIVSWWVYIPLMIVAFFIFYLLLTAPFPDKNRKKSL